MRLRLDLRLIDQHDRYAVFHRVDTVALSTFQGLGVLEVVEGFFAGWTHQHFQEVFGNHDLGIVRHGMSRSPPRQGDTEERKKGLRTLRFSHWVFCSPGFLRVFVSPW